MASNDCGLILVTGASGYIAAHVIQQLLDQGQRVRGTVRSLKNELKVKPIRDLCPDDASDRLELVEADLMVADSWPKAVEGCQYVLHIASPFPNAEPKHEDEVIKPAVDGTLNVLRAVRDAKCVKRVVLTSSVAAVSNGFDQGGDYSETDWTDVSKVKLAYSKSKTLAEKAAWDFVNDLPEGQKFELATINPSFVMGPVLCGTFTTSMEVCKKLMEKEVPMVPRINFAVTDVRDVASAHIRAMTCPESVGQRHIIAAGNIWFVDIAKVVEKEFKSQGYNVPTTVAPYGLLWIFGIFDKSVKLILPSVNKITKFNTNRMKAVLGIEPIPLEKTIIDMCYSLVEQGHVKKAKGYTGPPSTDM